MSNGRKVVLGVTGSIAAHKAVDIASTLTKQGCQVKVILTADAQRFITPLAFKTLSRNPVITDLYDETEEWKPAHIQLADEADLLVIAPASANTLAKMAVGLADNALTCVALALNPKSKVLLAPAMNGKMWLHAATQQNVAVLKTRGAEFIGPEEGLLACGYEGVGRMWGVERIVQRALEMLQIADSKRFEAYDMSFLDLQAFRRIPGMMTTSPMEPELLEARIWNMERNIVLPVKTIVFLILFYHLFFSKWFDTVTNTREIALEVFQRFFLLSMLVNVAAAIMLIGMSQVSLRLVELVVFAIALVDALLVGGLTVISGGFDSMLYWVFLVLIARNAVSVPAAPMQILLNLLTSFIYLVSGLLEAAIARFEPVPGEPDVTAEPFLLRVVLLLLMTFCCYAVQVLMERQRRAEEEAREYTLRQEQLRVTSRLAAEIAHQLKNPLSIINNAAFNLQRNVKEGKATITQQIRIIREEVERSDRIITDMMGYARMVDGNLERLSATEMLDHAIDQVFPPAAHYAVQIHREYAPVVPPLMMQRNHLVDIFINLLQNAREAMSGSGNVWLTANYGENYSVVVTIQDDGPGIPAELREKVFEPYFTTREKGSGLGLAIVKHNIEIYGGTVRVESEPGKGAKFILNLPAKSLIKLRR